MKPQERVNVILKSKLEPSWKLLLVAVASHMHDMQLFVWVSPETLAEDTGLSRSTVMEVFGAMLAAGLVTRTDEGHKCKTTRIVWESLATYEPVKTKRGGKKEPSEDRTVPSDNRTLPSEHRQEASEDRTSSSPIIGPNPTRDPTKDPTREKGEARANPTPPDVQSSPPPETQTIRGSQAHVVLPKNDFVDFSPILALLVNVGIPATYAASTARKLVEAGITEPTDEVAMALDEFDLGRIVGSQRKGQTIKAFREAGWKPPKERGQSARGSPGGSTVVITETGERIEPRGPPGRPLTKSERQVEALQALKRKGGEDGRAVGNR